MDLISEPAYTEEEVTDIDIGFPGGEVRSFTLHKGDTMEVSNNQVFLTIPSIQLEVVLFLTRAHWSSKRTRTQRTPIKATPPTTQSPPASSTPTTAGAASPSGQTAGS